jgi:hypothetical protein
LEQYKDFDGSNCIDFESQDELHCNFGPALLYLMTSMRGGLWWVVVYGRVTWDWDWNWNWNADGHTKTNKYCDWSNTEVLAVPIALTLKVNITCIAIFALLSLCWQ